MFLNLKDEYNESDLEDALIEHLEAFLLELGAGFRWAAATIDQGAIDSGPGLARRLDNAAAVACLRAAMRD